MRALVTGGAGFIGSTLVDRLLADGDHVDVVDNLSTGSLANLAVAETLGAGRYAFHEIDIREHDLGVLVADGGPEVIFHLAAQADVRVSVADPSLDATINILGTINVLESARRNGARKVVLASSGGTIYGEVDPSELPVREDRAHRPVSPYGVAKDAAGKYLDAYRAMYGIEGTALALANVYGPRQDAQGEAGVVAIFGGKLITGSACTIFGTGEQTRDFVYVDDVVDAFVRAAHVADGQLLNVATGREVSVNELYTAMAQAAGSSAPAVYAPARAGELDRSCLDASRAREVLGWKARTSLADGLKAVIDALSQRR